ncbi:MAG: iron transporter, partial [Mycobacterium sp.]
LGAKAFDMTGAFNWSSWYGQVIQGVFNISPAPSILQFVCWLAYLVVVLTLFLRPVAAKPAPAATLERSAK